MFSPWIWSASSYVVSARKSDDEDEERGLREREERQRHADGVQLAAGDGARRDQRGREELRRRRQARRLVAAHDLLVQRARRAACRTPSRPASVLAASPTTPNAAHAITSCAHALALDAVAHGGPRDDEDAEHLARRGDALRVVARLQVRREAAGAPASPAPSKRSVDPTANAAT